jgi:LytR cell envelope-related transcriptional attenuator/LytR_cpsA_psr family
VTAPGDLDDIVHLEGGAPATRGNGDLPPLSDWPPPEILERWAARRASLIRRRRTRRRLVALIALAGLLVGGFLAVAGRPGKGSSHTPAAVEVKPGAVAMSLDLGVQRVVAVAAVPQGIPPVVVAIPAGAEVDITGGDPITVSEAAATPGLLVAAVQAALDRRVEHYVSFDTNALSNLIGSLGGVDVQTDESFSFGGQLLGPGPVHATGGAALAYLQSASPEDVDVRWEEVLAGVFAAKRNAGAWRSLFGQSDAIDQVRVLLDRAQGAFVLELPTTPTLNGGIAVDGTASADLVERHFGAPSGRLVRVIVLNGNGRPTVGRELAQLLAPAGFRVVAAQDAASFRVTQTEIVAADDGFAPDAERILTLLGIGMVYVDSQPTGIADITIKVGRDFKSG